MWIKICGIRDVDTALAVARLGPQAIGLNFFEGSPRVVAPHVAAEIVRLLPAEVEPVGVFVNHTIEQITSVCRQCGLQAIQLHGDEPPELLVDLATYKVLRAFRVGESGLDDMADYLQRCQQLGVMPAACLVDARVEGVYGGTGQTAPWKLLRGDYRSDTWPPLILAGGLRPDNVAAAMNTVQPWGIDVAGGVESSPGCKDLGLVRTFIERVRMEEES